MPLGASCAPAAVIAATTASLSGASMACSHHERAVGWRQVLDSVFMSAVVLLGGFWAVAAARPGVLRNRPQPPSADEARLTLIINPKTQILCRGALDPPAGLALPCAHDHIPVRRAGSVPALCVCSRCGESLDSKPIQVSD